MGELVGLNPTQQMAAWESRVKDPRPRVGTGFEEFDQLLVRGGFAPGHLAILGGRTGTRKTTVMLNMAARMLASGVAVGIIGLDETPPDYTAKLASIFFDRSVQELEEVWDTPYGTQFREEYEEYTSRLSLTRGSRPSFQDMTDWLTIAEVDCGRRPQVVFLDYTSLLARNKFDGGEVQRVARLVEGVQVWTNEQEVVTILLHQVGRDSGSSGEVPLMAEDLKYGGEEIADIVMGTYRPAKNRLGNMTRRMAEVTMGANFDEEAYELAVTMVRKERENTYLQLLKNRPGTELSYEGVKLWQPNSSLYMHAEDVPAPEQPVRLLEVAGP